MKIEPFRSPEQPATLAGEVGRGWVREQRRDPKQLRAVDWNFKPLTDAARSADEELQKAMQCLKEARQAKADEDRVAASEMEVAECENRKVKQEAELAACAWYEYARECARVRAVAATYAKHFSHASGMGRKNRYRENKDKWAAERAAHQAMMRPKMERLFETLKGRVEKLKGDGLHKFAEEFERRWWQRLNDIEIKDPTPSLDWITTCTWKRVEWLSRRMEIRSARLRAKWNDVKAARFEARWKPRLEQMADAGRAWRGADEWMRRVQDRCSIGVPCLHTLASWLAEDCPWQEIRDAKEPELNVKAIAIDRGPKADDQFWQGGKGRHPIPGLSGGLQLNAGFETISPRSAFCRRTGRDGELLSDDSQWTRPFQFKDFRTETFVGKVTWNRPDREIVDDFERWLKWRRSLQPDDFRRMDKRPSRTRWDDPAAALSDLAALRLRACFGASDGSNRWALHYSEASNKKGLDKANQEVLARQAARSAVSRATSFLEDWGLDSVVKED